MTEQDKKMMTQALAAVLAEFEGFFFRGAKANYDAAVTHKDKLYFATDTGEILMNGKPYVGNGVKDAKLEVGDKETSFNGKVIMTLTMQNGTTKTLALEDMLWENGLLTMFVPTLDNSVATVDDLGGIPAGTTVGELRGKQYGEILEELIFPTVNPTFVAPSAKLSLKSTSATPTIQEVGTTGASVPTEASFNTSFDKGQIKIGTTKQADRAGALNAENSFIYINGDTSDKEFPTEIPEGSITYKYRAAYAQGPQPKDSKGNNYGSPLPAGTVDSAAVTVNGVYPYFANKGDINTFVKLPLQTSNVISGLVLPAEGGGKKHAFKLPAKYTLTKVELLNTLSGKYEAYAISNFTRTTENIQVQGKQVQYAVYTRNDSGNNGSVTMNITFTK